MAIELHREPLYRRYYSSIFSYSFFYISIIWFLIIFLPLIIAYNSYNFWIKDATYYEQPSVSYRYELITEVFGKRVSSGQPISLFYSTSPLINQQYESTLRSARISSIEQDDNNDGKVDRLELNVVYPISSDENIYGFSAIVYSDVQISDQARYIFDSMTYVTHESSTPLSDVDLDGNLLIRQSRAFDGKGGYKKPYGEEPLLVITNDMSAESVSISKIMSTSNARNFSLTYQPYFAYGTRASIIQGIDDKTINYFNASITMRVPVQPLRYTPPPAVLLKNAWIQYVAYLIVVAFLLTRLNSFVFRHQLLYAYPVADVVVEKMD